MGFFPNPHDLLYICICDDVRHQALRPASVEKFHWTQAIRSGTIVEMSKVLLKICLTVNAFLKQVFCYAHVRFSQPIARAVVRQTWCVVYFEFLQHFFEGAPELRPTINPHPLGDATLQEYLPGDCCHFL